MKNILTITFISLLMFVVVISTNQLSVKSQVIPSKKVESSMVDDLNQSIIDGFFDGDTTGKDMSGYHFVK